MTDPIQSILGISLILLLAGLFGGLVRALIRPGVTLVGAILSTTTGALAAACLTQQAALLADMGLMPTAGADAASVEHGLGFAIGLTGMSLCEGIVRLVKRWKEAPYLPGSPPRPPRRGGGGDG